MKKFFTLLNWMITFGLIMASLSLASIGSGWEGEFRFGLIKISLHNLKNPEIAFWFLLLFKVILLCFARTYREEKKEKNLKLKISPRATLMVYLLVILLLAIFYKDSMQSYFLNDDCLILRDVKKGFYNSVLMMPEFAHKYGVMRPTTFFTWFLDYKLFSINPLGWYLTNLFLQLIAILFVFLFANTITQDRFIAIIVSGLFGLSPIHHEVMNWIAARADLVCGIFYFASLYTYLLFRKNNNQVIYMGFSLIFFVLALLSKETAVSLPLVILMCEVLLSGDHKLKNWHLYAFYFGILVLYLLARFLTFGTLNPGPAVGGAAKILLENIPEYIKGAFLGLFVPMFFPVNWFSVESFKIDWIHYLSFLNAFILCLLIIFNLKKILKNRVLIFSLLFIICGSSVLFNIWEIGKSLHASRYYYFISLGFYLFIATLCLADNKSAWQRRLNLCGLCIIFSSNLIFVKVNNLSWEKAGRIPLKVIAQTKKIFPNQNKASGTLYFYGLPKEVAGVVVYSIEPQVITEQLSHFYKNVPTAVLVRPRGIMIDLNNINLSRDKVLQWEQKEERLYDLTQPLKNALKNYVPKETVIAHALKVINDIGSWDKSEQVKNLGEKGHFAIRGKDGFFFSQEASIPAKSLPYLSVRMKVVPKSKKYLAGSYSGRLYWNTDKMPIFNDERFFEFWLNPEHEFVVYNLYFIRPEEVLGDENIMQFKFLPAYFPCDLYIDYIKLVINR